MSNEYQCHSIWTEYNVRVTKAYISIIRDKVHGFWLFDNKLTVHWHWVRYHDSIHVLFFSLIFVVTFKRDGIKSSEIKEKININLMSALFSEKRFKRNEINSKKRINNPDKYWQKSWIKKNYEFRYDFVAIPTFNAIQNKQTDKNWISLRSDGVSFSSRVIWFLCRCTEAWKRSCKSSKELLA